MREIYLETTKRLWRKYARMIGSESVPPMSSDVLSMLLSDDLRPILKVLIALRECPDAFPPE